MDYIDSMNMVEIKELLKMLARDLNRQNELLNKLESRIMGIEVSLEFRSNRDVK